MCSPRMHAWAPTRAKGTSRMMSSVAPLLLKHTSRSWREMMPMSPCRASWGLRNTALVPVDTSVWQIFCGSGMGHGGSGMGRGGSGRGRGRGMGGGNRQGST